VTPPQLNWERARRRIAQRHNWGTEQINKIAGGIFIEKHVSDLAMRNGAI
jgi:hypothetical protein